MIARAEDTSPVAQARAFAKQGRMEDAASIVAALLHEQFGIHAAKIRINSDIYSLNSLNGTFEAAGELLFFKFHQEENESAMAGEYYRARLLAEAGLPVDLPLHASSEPGRQILVYRRRTDPRFADVLRDLDFQTGDQDFGQVLAAEAALNARSMEVYRETLHAMTAEQSAAEPIHRLFHERLTTPGQASSIGGRFASFYRDKTFELPGLSITWRDLSDLQFVVNGITYEGTLGALFDEAFDRLRPDRLFGGGVTAHGDAHNANVWFAGEAADKHLVLFDPAFAGSHVPALLAEVKTTFHNVFAHPLWLYEPGLAEKRFRAVARREGATLHIEHDWRLSPVRLKLLELKSQQIWKPLLALLGERGLLPKEWRRIVKLALFLCPTLVMNLRSGPAAGPHNPTSSAIGLATAIAMGSEPATSDIVSDLLDGFEAG